MVKKAFLLGSQYSLDGGFVMYACFREGLHTHWSQYLTSFLGAPHYQCRHLPDLHAHAPTAIVYRTTLSAAVLSYPEQSIPRFHDGHA